MASSYGSPAPHEAPELHDSIDVGGVRFPSDPREGAVKVTVKTGADIEAQKANGKNGAVHKSKGKKVAEVTLVFTFTRRIYAASNSLRLQLDPGGVNTGKSWEARHPELSDRLVNALIFKSLGALERVGDKYSFTLEGDGWNEPAKALTGGTKTPKIAKPAATSAPSAADLANMFNTFAVTLGAASSSATAATTAQGVNSAAEAIRRAAAGLPPNPPFAGPEV